MMTVVSSAVALAIATGCGKPRALQNVGTSSPSSATAAATVAEPPSGTPACFAAATDDPLTAAAEPRPPQEEKPRRRGSATRSSGTPTALEAAIRKELETSKGDESPSRPPEDLRATEEKDEAPVVTTTSATVSRAPAAGIAPARLTFENRLPRSYELQRVVVRVDGALSYDSPAPPADLRLPPGDHVVELVADYRLNDPVLTYLRHYHVELRSSERVPAAAQPIAYIATAHVTGGATTPMDRAAALGWKSMKGAFQ